MTEQSQENYPSVQIEELKAIYDDYLYAVRQYERVLQCSSTLELTQYQMDIMYKDRAADFPWNINLLDFYGSKNFQDFLDEKIHTATSRAYITLQHTNPKEDNTKPITYVPEQFRLFAMNMPLPAPIERYSIVYPKDATLGNTRFYIDGYYYAEYDSKENADIPLSKIFENPMMQAEFRVLINMVNDLYTTVRKSRNPLQFNRKRFDGLCLNVYASENTSVYENMILEILGSFAEKTRAVCRKIYGSSSSRDAFQRAEDDGFIKSAADFRDYINIRHLMRHQWDTMDELGYFRADRASNNASTRAKYLQSYTRLCDKTTVQRMKSYVDILPQMQCIMRRIMPERFIRENSESNTKFVHRIREYRKQNPGHEIMVELNHPLVSDKYKSLSNNLHRIDPKNIKIMDDFEARNADFTGLENDYLLRANFLRTYSYLECCVMMYSLMHGEDLDNKQSWQYFKDSGMMSDREWSEWCDYRDLRNLLSHNYYHPMLREKIADIEKSYMKLFLKLNNRIYDAGPKIKWLQKGVYEYIHQDGLAVTLDFNTRRVVNKTRRSVSGLKLQGKIDLSDENTNRLNKGSAIGSANTPLIKTSGEQITFVKLPSGVEVDMFKRRIIWSSDVRLYTEAENYNVLHTAGSKIFTDKNLRVTQYLEKNKSRPVGGNEIVMVDYKHRLTTDSQKKLKSCKIKTGDGKFIEGRFFANGNTVGVTLPDNTQVLFRHNRLEITHNGVALTYETRRQFAATYSQPGMIPPQNTR